MALEDHLDKLPVFPGGGAHRVDSQRRAFPPPQPARSLAHDKPTIYIGLDERDAAAPNTEFVNAPISLFVPVTQNWRAGVQSGVAGPLDQFADAYRIPAGVMAQVALSPAMSAQVAFNLDRIAGGGDTMPTTRSTDARSLMLTVGWVK